MCHEANISAKQDKTTQEARLPCTHEHGGGEKGPEQKKMQGETQTYRIRRAEIAEVII
jgi:hypothetical protein